MLKTAALLFIGFYLGKRSLPDQKDLADLMRVNEEILKQVQQAAGEIQSVS